MALPYRERPLKELKTARDWLYAVYDFAYEGDLSNINKIEKAVINDLDSQMIDLTWKQAYADDWPAWEEWVCLAISQLERYQNSDKSIGRMLNTRPYSRVAKIGSSLYKFLLCKKIVQEPPNFLRKLALQDKKLCGLLNLDREHDIKADKTTEAQLPELPGLNPLQRKRFLFIWEGPKTIGQITQSEKITASTWRSYLPTINTNSYPYEIFRDNDGLYKIRSLEG